MSNKLRCSFQRGMTTFIKAMGYSIQGNTVPNNFVAALGKIVKYLHFINIVRQLFGSYITPLPIE